MPDISVREITKAFSSVLAVDHVSIDFHAGEIHAILGENGAGKSLSCISSLACIVQIPATFSSTVNRIASHRLALPLLLGSLGPPALHADSVVYDCRKHSSRTSRLQQRSNRSPSPCSASKDLATQFGINIESPDTPVAALSVGSQQRVEILKTLAASARVLIFDEPTAVLHQRK